MDSGTSMIFGVATSDRVRRVYNAVISTGREAANITAVDGCAQRGWTERNKQFVERLEMVASTIIDPAAMVSAARHLIRDYMHTTLKAARTL